MPCCVGLLFGTQPCFSGSLFWSVCAEGLLIVVPDGTKSGWVGRWVRACASVVSVWFIVLCFYDVCCDPIPNLLRGGLPMKCWTARRKFIGLGAEAPPLLAVSRTTRINNFLKCLVAIVFTQTCKLAINAPFSAPFFFNGFHVSHSPSSPPVTRPALVLCPTCPCLCTTR